MHAPDSFITPPAAGQRNDRRNSVSLPLSNRKSPTSKVLSFSDSKLNNVKRSLALFNDNQSTSTPNSYFFFWLTFLAILSATVIGMVSNVATTTYLLEYLPTFDTPKPNRILFMSFHEPLETPDTGKPKLVIHMGPHKTASTTMQTDLTYYQDRLALDNYVYLGRLYHPFDNGHRIVLNRTPDSNIQTAFRNMFQRCFQLSTRECVTNLRDLLRFNFRRITQTTPNLLISDEAFLKLFDNERYGDGDETFNNNYILLKEILGQDWDIVIVLAYRRFYQWLPSCKHQKDKPTTERAKSEWPGNSTSGVPVRPLFPADESRTAAVLDAWKREHFFTETTIRTLKMITDSSFQVKIYHLYGKVSVRTSFLCNVLPHAEYSCRASKKQDVVLPETRINARESTENEIVRYPSAFFDLLATSAVRWIDTAKWQRQTVASLLEDQYYTASEAWKESFVQVATSADDIENTQAENIGVIAQPNNADAPPLKNPWSMPLICPSHEQLELLLKESISIEAKYLPKLYGKASQQHRVDFWQATTSPEYCTVDTEALLESSENPWKEFIIETFGTSNT